MSACEKCWSDAHRNPDRSVADEYARLMKERQDNPCTPEQQAGPDARLCLPCDRRTVHQITHECMACHRDDTGEHAVYEVRDPAPQLADRSKVKSPL